VDLVSWLRAHQVGPGSLVGIAVGPDGSVALAAPGGARAASPEQLLAADRELRPRWAVWSQETARALVAAGVRLTSCWDVAAVHRLLFGGWRADPAYAWALLNGVPADQVPAPVSGEPDLFSFADEPAPALGPAEALAAAELQRAQLQRAQPQQAQPQRTQPQQAAPRQAAPGAGSDQGIAVATARAESTVELLAAELAADGLPMDRAAIEGLLAELIGPRPRGPGHAAEIRAARDERVLRHAPAGVQADLRSNVQVRTLLAAAGIDVRDTRAWRLEEFKDKSPLVAALLEWRKAERIATTYGYAWLDESLGPDDRLRGAWTGCDGAAGRMTASSGLHNMPAVLRKAVIAEPGHLFVRADLGQIEPRVLAAVSGDAALAAATAADDMYLPVAAQLSVDRPTAKVAMIAAMYGQTTGHGGNAGRRMRSAYPVAMGYLDTADRSAQAGQDLRTYGGRLIRMSGGAGAAEAESPGARTGRGRYGRNAVIQGAAAELFKMWAVTVRARAAPLGARIVLCLHDELLVHVPEDRAAEAASLVGDCLAETAGRWAPGGPVRFIADISTVRCWADAKG
jgi:DNA polymerase-1